MKKKHTILIVDDQEINRHLLGNILAPDYYLLYAADGKQALSVLRNADKPVSAVLLDILMPVMDGYQVLEAMKADPHLSAIPVLVITQKAGSEEELLAFSLGAYDFISKPYHPQLIRHRVDRTIWLMESTDRLRRAESRAMTDPLTGLANRRAFEESVGGFLETEPEGSAAFLMIDLDNFKTVNDLYGHLEGDLVLKTVSKALQGCFSPGETVARLGGDEFAALIPHPDWEKLPQRLEAICRSVAALEEKCRVACTIGVSGSPGNGQDYASLYRRADIALLTAKRMGKNQFQIYSDIMNHPVPMQMRNMEWLLDEIEEAVLITDRETREILYLNQPAADLAGTEKRACLGKECYRTIWGRETPCPFCATPQQVGTGIHQCFNRSASHGKIFRVITQMIEWDEKPARLQYIWDITKENTARKQMDIIFSSLQVGLVKCEADGKMIVTDANDVFYHMIGCTRSQFPSLYGNSLYGLLSAENVHRLATRCAQAVSDMKGFSQATELIVRDGRHLPVIDDISVFEESGKLYCFHAFTDVRRSKQLWESYAASRNGES